MSYVPWKRNAQKLGTAGVMAMMAVSLPFLPHFSQYVLEDTMVSPESIVSPIPLPFEEGKQYGRPYGTHDYYFY